MAYNSPLARKNYMKNPILLLVALFGFSLAGFSQINFPRNFPGQYPTENGKQKKQKKDRRDNDRDRDIFGDPRVDNGRRNLPPGQAKKIYGSKSAKEHAPGQRKKQNGNNGSDGIWGDNGTYGNNGNYPPEVITVEDRYVQRDNQGRLFYVDQNGNVYYRRNDGRYYLDRSSVRGNRDNSNYENDWKGRKKGKGKGRN